MITFLTKYFYLVPNMQMTVTVMCPFISLSVPVQPEVAILVAAYMTKVLP